MPCRLELSLINWVATNQPVSASGVHADVEDSCVHSSITVQVRSASTTGATRSRDPLNATPYCPAPIATDMNADDLADSQKRNSMLGRIPAGRLGQPEDPVNLQ